MKVSDNDLAYTQNCQHRLKIVCPNEILKSWIIELRIIILNVSKSRGYPN